MEQNAPLACGHSIHPHHHRCIWEPLAALQGTLQQEAEELSLSSSPDEPLVGQLPVGVSLLYQLRLQATRWTRKERTPNPTLLVFHCVAADIGRGKSVHEWGSGCQPSHQLLPLVASQHSTPYQKSQLCHHRHHLVANLGA